MTPHTILLIGGCCSVVASFCIQSIFAVRQRNTSSDSLAVYILVQFGCLFVAQWLQGPYLYPAYEQYGMSTMSTTQLISGGDLAAVGVVVLLALLSDCCGRRSVLLAINVLFVVSAIGIHFPDHYTVLLLSRIVGSVGSALLLPVALSVLFELTAFNSEPDGTLRSLICTVVALTAGGSVLADVVLPAFVPAGRQVVLSQLVVPLCVCGSLWGYDASTGAAGPLSRSGPASFRGALKTIKRSAAEPQVLVLLVTLAAVGVCQFAVRDMVIPLVIVADSDGSAEVPVHILGRLKLFFVAGALLFPVLGGAVRAVVLSRLRFQLVLLGLLLIALLFVSSFGVGATIALYSLVECLLGYSLCALVYAAFAVLPLDVCGTLFACATWPIDVVRFLVHYEDHHLNEADLFIPSAVLLIVAALLVHLLPYLRKSPDGPLPTPLAVRTGD